ncbi:MAG: AmmeMemoRadiSam system radical SAM enzyme [Candidatus Eisenbacteria bacterium]
MSAWFGAPGSSGAGLGTGSVGASGSLGGSGAALAAGPLDELLARAPVARYWASNARDSDCTACHAERVAFSSNSPEHDGSTVRCLLCAHECVLRPNERGRCHVRINVEGELRTLVYGRPITMHVDPIEKGPFYHFLPGSKTLTMATAGCPLSCKFCQNWQISQAQPEDRKAPFTEADGIVHASTERNLRVVTFTYNEPTVYVEYMTDIAREARANGVRTALVSCGLMNPEPLAEVCEVLDAIKIDLKGFSTDFYEQVCRAELAPVLRTIAQVAKSGVHLEIVNLVVPTLNDSDEMLRELADWVMGEVGPDVPLHFTRFSPAFQLQNLSPTPLATLERARDLAMSRGLRYVYVGNAPGHPGNSTYCPDCGERVIHRNGFFVQEETLEDGKCGSCGAPIPGVFS